MHSHTRALRRAADAAAARRPAKLISAAMGGLLGLTLAVGVAVSASAATGNVAPARFNDRAAATLVDAERALEAAQELTSEVAGGSLDLGTALAEIDTASLADTLDALDNRAEVSPVVVAALVVDTAQETDALAAATAALETAVAEAEEKKAAEEAARAAEEEAAQAAEAEAAAAAAALASSNTVAGAKATAEQIAASDYGWGADQFSCLDSLWTKESGWNYQAFNASSGATGIPQALPGSKMASAGSDWQTNARTQIVWGLGYIASVYGSPCAAWSHSQSVNWY